MKVIVLANALMNSGNRGCVALSISSLYLIDQILSDAKIDYRIYLPDDGWNDGKERNIKIGEKQITYISCEYPIGVSFKQSLFKIFQKITGRSYHDNIFRNADVIFDIGQGDSFTDIYGLWRFKTIDRIHKVARKFSKPYCFLPQTIGPFNNESLKKKACKSLKEASLVMARDKASLDFVKKILPNKKEIEEYIDVAFFLPYTKKNFDDNFTHIGINISALLWNGGYTKENQFGLICDYRSCVNDVISYYLSKEDVIIHLIPHVVLQESDVENDYEISFQLYEKYNNKRIILAPFFLSPIDAKSYISGLDFFIGARMHSTIAAFSAGIPVVPMAYSRKFNGLFEETLNYRYFVDMKTDSSEIVVEKIIDYYNNRSVLSKIIYSSLNSIVAEKKQLLIEHLKKILL